MPDRDFSFSSARMAPWIYLVTYLLALYFSLARATGYWALGLCSAWLFCAALDISRFGLCATGRIVALRIIRNQWQYQNGRRWVHAQCRLLYRCPFYLLIECSPARAGQLEQPGCRQIIWRDALSDDDWHGLAIYLQLGDWD